MYPTTIGPLQGQDAPAGQFMATQIVLSPAAHQIAGARSVRTESIDAPLSLIRVNQSGSTVSSSRRPINSPSAHTSERSLRLMRRATAEKTGTVPVYREQLASPAAAASKNEGSNSC
jgi:hypothetical protein